MFRRNRDDKFADIVIAAQVFLGLDQMLGKRAQCQPVRVLANRLIDNANKKQDRLTQETIAVYFVKVWNAYMCGREINSLKYTLGGAHPETFPDVYGRLDGS
mgnify:CR=1 FL=1